MNDENDDDDIETMRSSLVEQLQKKKSKTHPSFISPLGQSSPLCSVCSVFFFCPKKKIHQTLDLL